ncbi:HAD hydrolase%2C family IB [Mycobacterium tuberculosis]|nr:HAD hydrolase%2C family IB [Mycobacterium tuberculosis]
MTVSDSPAQRQTPPQTPGGTAPRARTAAFFDLDKTIIAKSSTLAFSKPFFAQGLLNRRAVLKSSYAQFIFLLSGADHDQMDRMRTHLTNMCAGWDVAQVRSIVNETLHDIVTPLVFAEAADLIAAHKLCGRDVVVVSASGEEIVGPIARALGATHAMATRMIVEDGKYTGEVAFYCYGEGKAKPSVSWLPVRATRWNTATRTPTRSPICRCLRRLGMPRWSTLIAAYERKPACAVGPCCRSLGRCRCATGSRHRQPRRSPRLRRWVSAP